MSRSAAMVMAGSTATSMVIVLALALSSLPSFTVKVKLA